jgi:6,7-dimethyl-8-ribityllumazine synthase
MATIEGSLSAKGFKFALVTSRVNELITTQLLEGAKNTLLRHGASESNIDIIKVPGSFELPFAVQQAAKKKKYNCIVAIGSIIKGQTSHYDFLASQVTNDLSKVALDTGVPVTLGVLTTETVEQAIDRSGVKGGNRGSDAALSAIEMANLVKAL